MQTPQTTALHPEPHLRQRILVVEGEPALRRLNAEVLICSGYNVDAAEDAEVAWGALRANNYDLMVTDHNVPNLSGVNLLKKARAARLALPISMATGTMPGWTFCAYPSLRPMAVLLKPYTHEELLALVKDVLYSISSTRTQPAPWPNWQGQSLPNRSPL